MALEDINNDNDTLPRVQLEMEYRDTRGYEELQSSWHLQELIHQSKISAVFGPEGDLCRLENALHYTALCCTILHNTILILHYTI